MNRTFDKNNIKIAAFDVDGTVFHEGRISNAAKDAIKKLHEQGIITVIATGRMRYYMVQSVLDLGVFRYGVFGNGSVVWDFEEEKTIAIKAFESKMAEELLRCVDTLSDAYSVDFENENGMTPRLLSLIREEFKLEVPEDGSLPKEIHTVYENLLEHVAQKGEPIVKMRVNFLSVEERIHAMNKIGDAFNIEISSTSGKDIGITPFGANKGSGLEALCTHLGADISNVIAFGDGGNDVEMLKRVGFAVVLGNGQDSAKAVSDYIAKPVWEDGVALAISELFGV